VGGFSSVIAVALVVR